jgi:FAD/FMN-containing dehydrogenase
MNTVRVDPEAKLAYVAGGCLWGDVDEATVKHGVYLTGLNLRTDLTPIL